MKNTALTMMATLLTGQMALAQFTSYKPFDYEREDYKCSVTSTAPKKADKNTPVKKSTFVFGKDETQNVVIIPKIVHGETSRFVITRKKHSKSIEVYATDAGKAPRKELIKKSFEDGGMIELVVPTVKQRLLCLPSSTFNVAKLLEGPGVGTSRLNQPAGTMLYSKRLDVKPQIHGEYLLPHPAAKMLKNSKQAEGKN